MSRILDWLINLIKWPVAIWLFCSLPALFNSLDAFSFSSLQYIVLAGGFFMFFIGRTFMDSSSRASMEVLAHELTHAFFALITFHKVKNININDKKEMIIILYRNYRIHHLSTFLNDIFQYEYQQFV